MTAPDIRAALGALAADARLWSDFLALCDCGGRQAGTASEAAGLELVERQLRSIGAGTVSIEHAPYAAWRPLHAALEVVEPGGRRVPLVANALLGTQSTPPEGLEAEIIDAGRGTPEEFAALAGRLSGRVVLVSHEYPFAPGHIHRRRKYNAAMEAGAVGFVIFNPVPGNGPTCGSSGRGGGSGIPAIATDYESGMRLRRAAADGARASMRVTGEDSIARTPITLLDLPGVGPERVVLSAHVDGHALGESAMDNATGCAAAVAIARAFAPVVAPLPRGLRVCLFSAEEWALAGSKAYLAQMDPSERARIVLNVNLDTIAGGSRLTALTSEFPALDAFVQAAAGAIGQPLSTYRPLMSNSDHHNFALHGIPAMRLVTGFDEPASNVRYILTPADTRDKVAPGELKAAALTAAAIVWRGLTADAETMAGLARR